MSLSGVATVLASGRVCATSPRGVVAVLPCARAVQALVHVLVVLGALGTLGCAESSQTRVQVPLEVQGTASVGPRTALGGVPVTLTRADLAFGPLYLCAGAQAGELCETARLEWLDTVVVDALDPVAQEAGTLYGVSGTVQSWMFDLGISAQLTRDEPFVLEAAEALGGSSLVLEGSAEISGITVPFVAHVPVQQTSATELGVPVVRKSASDAFGEDVDGDERALQVRFDPAAWLAGVDLRSLVTFETCATGETALRCDGTVEWTCDGGNDTSRDCDTLAQVCAPGLGCVDHVELASTSEPFRALRNALVAGPRPSFTWTHGAD